MTFDQFIVVLNVIPQLDNSPEESSDENQVQPPVPCARTKPTSRLVDSPVTQGKFKSNVFYTCLNSGFEAIELIYFFLDAGLCHVNLFPPLMSYSN